MKRVIMNPFSPLPKSDKSHVRGWAQVWAERLNADIADKHTDISVYDEIYIDHGVNFSGGLNLFGGFNDEVMSRVEKLIECSDNFVKIYSLDYDMRDIDYASQMAKRLGAKSTSERLTESIIDACRALFSDAETFTMYDLPLDKLILGDSHSVAYSLPDQIVDRNNGKTLYSAIMKDPNWVIDKVKSSGKDIKHLTLCLGSIDIRFHAIRDGRPDAESFAKAYVEAIRELSNKLEIPVSACAPAPIEFEERRIPGTGKYEGENFFGSRQERLDFTLQFIETLKLSGIDLVMPPKEWYEMDGEKYAKEIMEAASSVHIAPKNYNSILRW